MIPSCWKRNWLLTCSGHHVLMFCGPYHHKGSRPLLDITCKLRFPHDSSWDVPVCSNTAATVSLLTVWQLFCYTTRAAVLFSCLAVLTRVRRPYPCATQRITLRDTFLLLYSNKTKYKPFIKVLVVLALKCLPPSSNAEEVELCDAWTFNWL